MQTPFDSSRATTTFGKVTTTNNTQTTLESWVIPNNSNVNVFSIIKARRADGQSMTGMVICGFKNINGTVTRVNSTTAFLANITEITSSVTHDTSGTQGRLRVTGATGTTVEWSSMTFVF